MTKITFSPPAGAITYPDSSRYKGGFGVRSSSGNKIYKISFDAAPAMHCWVCSCPGNISHGQCKHLSALGLKGRKYRNQQMPHFVTSGK